MTHPKRGEIYLVNFDPTVGAEIRKTRPALILQPRLPIEGSQNAPAFGVLYPDMDKISTLGAFYVIQTREILFF